jgi:hypothetical protein
MIHKSAVANNDEYCLCWMTLQMLLWTWLSKVQFVSVHVPGELPLLKALEIVFETLLLLLLLLLLLPVNTRQNTLFRILNLLVYLHSITCCHLFHSWLNNLLQTTPYPSVQDEKTATASWGTARGGGDDNNNNFILYALFWVIPRRLNFILRRFGTLCLFHLHIQVSAYEDGTECSEK